MKSKLKPWRLEPLQFDECLKYSKQTEVDRCILRRELPELDKLVNYICHLKGSYLITGYRGVGKTSFVNYALALAYQRLQSQTPEAILIPVSLNLSRSYGVEKLLRRIIRRLYQAINEAKIDLSANSKETGQQLYHLNK